MSPAQNKFPQSPKSPKSSSSSAAKTDNSASQSPEPPLPAETIMDQHPESTLIATPLAPPTPSEVMSSTVPDQVSSTTASSSDSSDSSKNSSSEASSAALSESVTVNEESSEQLVASRLQPIPPASEPMQYRAIGLVRGRYVASEEQFTRGTVYTEDGVPVDAVLLGRVMSLVKKHLDLEQPHLWVVYPRTREKGSDLHVQIVGVWEPEKLNRGEDFSAEETAEGEESESSESEETAPEIGVNAVASSELDDRYFSVRGEVVYQSVENQQLLVKIRRSPRQGSDESKIFKVALKGVLEGKAVGYFWDLHVQRQENELVLQEATLIGMVPPQKRTGSQRGGQRRSAPPGRPDRKSWNAAPSREGGPRPTRSGDRPTRPSAPREPIAKPIKRRTKDDSQE